jgi:hypothetical protein
MRPLADVEAVEAAQSGNPDALRHALDQQEPQFWDHLMLAAVASSNLDCVRVLYDKGYQQDLCRRPLNHPAIFAAQYGKLEILRYVVDRSGLPAPLGYFCKSAVMGGVEMLQYVRELGCVFDEKTTEAAASNGDFEVLRYLHMSGAPWDSRTLAAAVDADSLPCLEYAHTHGCPQEVGADDEFEEGDAKSLPVLRYVCEHMDPVYAAKTLEVTASTLDFKLVSGWPQELWGKPLDWSLVLYLGRKLGPALPESVANAVATQKERAAAFAGVFFKARKQLHADETRLLHRGPAGDAHAERLALWDAMARVPKELQERIALEAHLIIP